MNECKKLFSVLSLLLINSVKDQFSIFANPIINRVYPPKFCIMIVFNFSWDMKMTREKSKTMPMQIFGRVKEVSDGICESGEYIYIDSV